METTAPFQEVTNKVPLGGFYLFRFDLTQENKPQIQLITSKKKSFSHFPLLELLQTCMFSKYPR